jgi:actin-like ATPase involved in cell morphogenesis
MLLEEELSAFVHEAMSISEDISKEIISEGIWMVGGGSRLRGLPERLSNKLNVNVNTVDNPRHVIVRGAPC